MKDPIPEAIFELRNTDRWIDGVTLCEFLSKSRLPHTYRPDEEENSGYKMWMTIENYDGEKRFRKFKERTPSDMSNFSELMENIIIIEVRE